MTTRTRARAARAAAVLVALGLLLAATACDGGPLDRAAADPAVPGVPDRPVGSPAVQDPGDPGDVAERVEPDPTAIDLRPRGFESAEPTADGRALVVRWWGGVAPCDVLGAVEVVETPEQVAVALQVGRGAGSEAATCIEIALRYEVVVPLSAPLGARTVVDAAA